MGAELIRLTPTVLLASLAFSLLLYSAASVGLAGITLVALALLLAAAGGAVILYLQRHWKQLRLSKRLTGRSPSPPEPVTQRQELLQTFLASQLRCGPSGLLVVSAGLRQTDDGCGAPTPLSETRRDGPGHG